MLDETTKLKRHARQRRADEAPFTLSKTWRRILLLPRTVLWVLFWLTCVNIAHADDRIELRSLYVTRKDDTYVLRGQVAIQLPAGALQAIAEGATFNLLLEANIKRMRRFWFDATEAHVEQSYEIIYHAISGRYLVRNVGDGEQESYTTLDAAMTQLTTLHDLPLAPAAVVLPEDNNEVSVRASINVRSLPKALGVLLFWTNDWAQTSGWHTWTLHP